MRDPAEEVSMRFFLVDDDPLMLEIQTDFLEPAGHEVTVETDSVLAFDRILKEKPEILITDLMMPGLDGYQLITKLRKERNSDALKIIVLSAKMFPQDQRQAIACGANGFIVKPVRRELYLEKINAILDAEAAA